MKNKDFEILSSLALVNCNIIDIVSIIGDIEPCLKTFKPREFTQLKETILKLVNNTINLSNNILNNNPNNWKK